MGLLPWATAWSPPSIGFEEEGPPVCLFAAESAQQAGWLSSSPERELQEQPFPEIEGKIA